MKSKLKKIICTAALSADGVFAFADNIVCGFAVYH